MWIFISANLFTNTPHSASQKYIQYTLGGEASDLATLNSFQSMAVLFTPIFGILMDKFYPMRLRIGPYLVVTEMIQIGCLLLIGTARLSMRTFMALRGVYTTAAITQAVIAMKTKLDIELKQKKKEFKDLRRELLPNQEQGEAKLMQNSANNPEEVGIGVYATFEAFSTIFAGLSLVLGGLLVDNLPNVKQAFLVTMTPNLVLLFFSVMFLKEKRQNTSFPEGKSLKEISSGTFKVITSKGMLLPIMIVMLINLAPSMAMAVNFITIKKVGWSYTQKGVVFAIQTFFMALILLQINRLTKVFSFDLMVFLGVLAKSSGRMLEVPLACVIFEGVGFAVMSILNGLAF